MLSPIFPLSGKDSRFVGNYYLNIKAMKKKEINEQLGYIIDIYGEIYRSISCVQKSVDIINKKLSRIEKDEISPCPFCGCRGELFCKLIDQEEFFYVKCTNGHCLSDMKETKEEAINEWNKRI